MDRRYLFAEHEVRIAEAEGDEPLRIVGYAARFNVLSVDLGGFRERILPGAFRQHLDDGADVRALFNHDPSAILGRRAARTLRVSEDDKGLRYTIHPPDTTVGRDLVQSIKRGDITGSSFGFDALDDAWHNEGGEVVREIRQARLWDVSPVTFPAYPETEVSLRSLFRSAQIDHERLARILCQHQHGLAVPDSDVEFIHSIAGRLDSLAGATPNLDAARERLTALET